MTVRFGQSLAVAGGRPPWQVLAALSVVIGVPLAALTAGLLVAAPANGAMSAAVIVVGLVAVVPATLVLHRRPWLAAWGVVVIFSTSSELRLRVAPALGVVKDAWIVLLLGLLLAQVVRHRKVLGRLRPLAGPLAAAAVLAGLYLLDPAGGFGSGWVFGTRLLLEVFALMLLGLLGAQPERTVTHLVRAMTVVLPLEAAFAWIQQWVGADPLVYDWGYRYGAQVRLTSGGGLRTSGSFEDPFQLAALAVLGIAIAFFVASRLQAVVLVVSGVAALGATSVRTALVQVGILLVMLAVRRGWWRQALLLGAVAAVGGVFALLVVTASVRPGAPAEPLLFNLNGRSTAWALAVEGPESLVIGNGVGARGIGSERESDSLVTTPPAYDPAAAPPAEFAGDPAFLDSAYAQVQSDVGIAGTAAMVVWLVWLAVVLLQRCRAGPIGPDRACWAALAVLAVSLFDWIGRSSLASYTTGFLTLYILGVLVAAGLKQEHTP